MNPPMFAYDWVYAYRPATLALLAGQSPYTITSEKFANAPWALIPLIPFALLPAWLGWLLLVMVSMAAFAFVAWRLGASHIAAIAFVLSPMAVSCMYYGQIDWLPLLGVIMPPWLGLFFVAIKPQTCGLIALYWLVEAWKAGTVIRTFAPVTIVTLLSFIPFGLWPMQAARFPQNNGFWPWSLILSIALLIASQVRKDKTFSVVASPLASPYIRLHSFIGILLPLLRYRWLMVATVAVLWLSRFVL